MIGVKKTMVFYKGKAPTGKKTKWKMNEYRAIEEEIDPSSTVIPKVHILTAFWVSFLIFLQIFQVLYLIPVLLFL